MATYLKAKVHAGENKNVLAKKSPDSFELWVKAPAEQGRANDVVRKILAEHLRIEEKKLILIKGVTSPSKIFLLRE